MGLISEIISGVISPVTGAITAIFTKKEDTALEKFKVDGQVDINLIKAHIVLIQANADLLKNQWIIALQFMFGVPLALWYGKCLIWDGMFGWGFTYPLTGDVATYSTWIVGFLFLHSAISSWNRKT